MRIRKTTWLIACLSRLIESTPTLNYAFNNQLPPIARYNENYHYELSMDSFTTDDSWMNMWGENLPDWLQFDGDSRTLSGTPKPDDDNYDDKTVSFRLVAEDSSGSAYCDCTLVVSNVPAPKKSTDVASVLDKSGALAGSESLVLTPGKDFEVDFSQDFWQKDDDATRDISGIYGKMADHAPLPNWLNFDQGDGKFYGSAPSVNSEIAPAQEFSVAFIVSDYQGYSSNQVKFNLLVGAHQFTTNLTVDNINATKGKNIRYQIPFDDLLLDNRPIERANISAISLNTTQSWLKLDNSTGVITGTPPKSLKDTEQVKVKVTDTYGDSLSYTLQIDVGKDSDSIFSSNALGRVNATQGQFFQYSLKDVLLNPNASVEASYSPKVDWITFHENNNTFTGVVPKSFTSSKVTLSASNGDKSEDERTTLTLTGVPAATKTKKNSSSSSSSTPSSSSTESGDEENDGASGKTIAIVCGTVIPLCVLGAVAVLFFCCRRGRQAESSSSSISEKNISGPIISNEDPEKAGGAIGPLGGHKPTSSDDSDPHWDSPQKISALNFMKMDSSGEDVNNHYYSSEETHVGTDGLSVNSPSIGGNSPAMVAGYSPGLTSSEKHVDSPTGLRGPPMDNSPSPGLQPPPAAATAPERDNRVSVRPRNSWRNTGQSSEGENVGRWQEHQSVGSLATISTDELLTMRLVDRQSYDSAKRDTYMSPTRSTILTPHHSMYPRDSVYPRDQSSGNIEQLGSHSSSIQRDQQQNYNIIHSHTSSDQSGTTASEISMKKDPGGDVDVDYYRQAMHMSTTTFQSDDNESAHEDGYELYRTASSGTDNHQLADDDASYNSSDQESLRPYRNSRGEMTWSQRSIDQLSSSTEMPTSRQSYGLAITTPDKEGGTISSRHSNRDTVRLVQHPERNNLRDLRTPEIEEDTSIHRESSAELAFL